MAKKTDQEVVDDMLEDMTERFGEDFVQFMAHQTRLYRLLTTVYKTNSTDPAILVPAIFEFYDGKVALELIRPLVEEYLPYLREDGLLTDDGVLTETGRKIAMLHDLVIR